MALDENRLERLGNFSGQPASRGQRIFEKRNTLYEGGAQIGFGEPDEVFEVGGNKFGLVDVGELKFQFDAGVGIGKGIGDLGEHAGVYQTLCGLLEIAFGGVLAKIEVAGRENLLIGVALGSGRLYRKEFVGC